MSKQLASGTKSIKVAVTLFVVAILLDSSLLLAASVSRSHTQPSPTSAQSTNSTLALLSTQAGIWSFTDGRLLSSNMSTRGEIIAFILTNPGVYMREIGEDLGLPMGVVQYHLWVLGRNGELEECRSGRYRRFFGANRYPETERRILGLLRQGTSGKILLTLSDQPVTHQKLANILGISSQALSWHTKRLRELGAVTIEISSQGERLYVLTDEFRQGIRACSVPSQRMIPEMSQTQTVR